ncbi:hypothetical protein DMC47_00770 [Nostoc sp. 3335mG]|nr:hypothetical protein DMC47_00770 [Nostoc sp. 3335mG]
MTDPVDTAEAPLSRTPARFFFEIGYFAAFADAYTAARQAGATVPFEVSDASIDRAWDIAPSGHPDPAEFDSYLSSANSADARLAEAEATYRAFDEANREADGTRAALARVGIMLRTYGADLFPANRAGQVHFARILMDSAASVIEARIANLAKHGKPVLDNTGIAMVEVIDADRAEFERALITHGFHPETARELAFDQPEDDGALQMLARHRIATLSTDHPGMVTMTVAAWEAMVAERDAGVAALAASPLSDTPEREKLKAAIRVARTAFCCSHAGKGMGVDDAIVDAVLAVQHRSSMG